MIAAYASSTFNYSQETLIRTLLLASVSAELFFATRHCLLVLSRVVVTADRLDEMAMPDPSVVTSAPFSDSIWVAEIGELAPVARVAIIGANGVGKSTWLRAVGQLDGSRPHQLLLGGVDAAQLNEATLRQRVGYLSAQPSYLRGVVGDVLTLGRRLHADPIVLLGDLGIHANASDRWSERSRGEDQRAGLVRALVTAPSLLLLDEPTSALGDTETSAVLRLLETRASRVIVVTHDPRVIAWCDAVYELRDGELLRR
jgi:putative ABC transport system ATP-binding protein